MQTQRPSTTSTRACEDTGCRLSWQEALKRSWSLRTTGCACHRCWKRLRMELSMAASTSALGIYPRRRAPGKALSWRQLACNSR